MAVEYTNDSYNRCIAELRARYKGRGIAVNVKNEIATQARREEASRAQLAEKCVAYDSRSMIGDQYRSGEYNGSKYMTSDDFVRYFKNRRSFYMPSVLKEQETEKQVVKNPAVPQRKTAASSRGIVPSDSDSKEGHLSNVLALIKEFAEKWFPVESKEGRTEGARFRIPVSVLSGMAVFMVSLGLIVSGSVMVGSASGELGRKKSEIAQLEAEQADLQGKLDLKYNVNDIEEEAKRLGMIKRQYADQEYLTVNSGEEITIYDENEDENVGLSALLAAFGIDIND
jgi:hypothetical protein